METRRIDLFNKTSLCVCSYMKSLRSHRASLVRGAVQTWDKFLELPFAEKIFLDDCSPEVNAIRLLKASDNFSKFDCVRYNTVVHPPHCNFGTLFSMSLCQGEYILHIDDDIRITASPEECLEFVERSIDVLDKDENILGINILTMPNEFDKNWFPGQDYRGRDDFAHPNKYFGSAASLIRKKLLDRVGLTDIINWGTQQPDVWEKLISHDPSSFLVSKVPTPFGLDLDAWVYPSVTLNKWRVIKKQVKYNVSKNLPFLKKFLLK